MTTYQTYQEAERKQKQAKNALNNSLLCMVVLLILAVVGAAWPAEFHRMFFWILLGVFFACGVGFGLSSRHYTTAYERILADQSGERAREIYEWKHKERRAEEWRSMMSTLLGTMVWMWAIELLTIFSTLGRKEPEFWRMFWATLIITVIPAVLYGIFRFRKSRVQKKEREFLELEPEDHQEQRLSEDRKAFSVSETRESYRVPGEQTKS